MELKYKAIACFLIGIFSLSSEFKIPALAKTLVAFNKNISSCKALN